jgi:ubiquinone/menaquinone biosynthesis C-methylase UbiE
VLDIGCGAGFDLSVASQLVGPAGRVYGVDLTEAMVLRARENLRHAGIANAEVQQVTSDSLPFRDNMFDAVISNGVINLSASKKTLFVEINRVLKPGGRFAFADVVLEQQLPEELKGSTEAWSQ